MGETLNPGSLNPGNMKITCFAHLTSKLNLKPVKRQQVLNFAKSNQRSSSTVKVVQKSESMRDSFASLVVLLAEEAKIKLDDILSFPITQYPLSIAHSDGLPLKTSKSMLLNKLETFQTSENIDEASFNVALFDGGYVLHSDLSKYGKISSYGRLAKSILTYVLKLYKDVSEVHMCLDTYSEASLKYQERERRGQEDSEFHITGPEQVPKLSNDKLLRNVSFKDELGKFLKDEWQKEEYKDIIGMATRLCICHMVDHVV